MVLICNKQEIAGFYSLAALLRSNLFSKKYFLRTKVVCKVDSTGNPDLFSRKRNPYICSNTKLKNITRCR